MRSAFGSAARYGIDPDTAEKLIRERIVDIGGLPNDRDIRRARDYVYGQVSSEGARAERRKPMPEVVQDKVANLAKLCGAEHPEDILRRASSVDPRSAGVGTVLGALYRPGEKVLIFRDKMSQGDFLYEIGSPIPCELPMEAPDGIFFLTNPVDGLSHPNPRENGKLSRRSMEAVTSFRYMLLESDKIPPDQWLRLVVALPLSIASVCHSGGKSIHALVRVDAADKEHFDRIREEMKPVLAKIGADTSATSAVRLSRLPTAFRGGVEQRLFYLNPEPTGASILDLASNPETR